MLNLYERTFIMLKSLIIILTLSLCTLSFTINAASVNAETVEDNKINNTKNENKTIQPLFACSPYPMCKEEIRNNSQLEKLSPSQTTNNNEATQKLLQ